MGITELTAEELRARRKARIAGNGEQRLAKILSGPSGEEKRRAPCLEGGEPMSSENLDKISELADTIAPLAGSSSMAGDKTPNETVDASLLWRTSLSKRRHELIIWLALALAILVTTYKEFHVTFYWIIAFVMLEWFLKDESAMVGESQLLNLIAKIPLANAHQDKITVLVRCGAIWSTFLTDSTIFYFFFISAYLSFNWLTSNYYFDSP